MQRIKKQQSVGKQRNLKGWTGDFCAFWMSLLNRILCPAAILSVLMLFVATSAFAVTEFVSTVNQASEDYDTLTLWEDAMDNAVDITAADVKVFSHGGITGTVSDGASVTGQSSSATGTVIHATSSQILIDAISGTFTSGEEVRVTAGNSVTISDAGDSPIITAELYNDDGTLDDRVTIDGLTTSATNYWKITVPSSERHDGTAGTGPVIDPSTDGHVFTVSDDNVLVEWVEVTGWTGSSNEAFRVNNTGFILNNAILHDAVDGDSDGVFAGASTITMTVNNTIMYNIGRTGVHVQNKQNVTVYVNNCTLYKMKDVAVGANYCGLGTDEHAARDNSGSVFIIKNTTVDAESGEAYHFGGGAGAGSSAGSDFNASDDATAPGTTVFTNVVQADQFVSVTASSEDFHLKSGSIFPNAGTDLGTTANIDIDGRDRDALDDTWDIGADESAFIDISGTTDLSSGTVKVAVNSILRSATTSISGSVWTVSSVSVFSDDTVIVYVDAQSESNETTAASKYDGAGHVTGMVLNKNIFSIGSADDQSLTATNLGQYDNADDENIMHMFTSANVLTIDASATYANEMLDILSGDTLTIATDETLEAHNVNISGTLTATGSATLHVSGSWTNAGTFTANSSHVMFTGTESETLTSGGASYNDVTLNDGLVGYWKLDETSAGSIAVDLSGYGHNGTPEGSGGSNNNPQPSSTVPSVHFMNQKSFDFDGTDDIVRIPDAANRMPTKEITVAAWVKGGSQNNKSVVSQFDWAISQRAFDIGVSNSAWAGSPTDKIGVLISENGTTSSGFRKAYSSTNTAFDDTWHHIAFTFSSDNLTLYLDGSAETPIINVDDEVLSLHDSTADVTIGARLNSDAPSGLYIGLVDDVRIYNRALSAAEIARLAAGRQPVTGSGTYTLQDALDVNGDLVLNSGALDVNTNKGINVAGSWMNHGGVFTEGSGTVTLDGTASGKTLLSGQQEFNNLTVSGAGGEWTFNDDATVSGALTLTAGTLTHSTLLDPVTVTGNMAVNNGTFSGVAANFILDGDLTFSSGTFTAPSEALILKGDVTQSGGTFSHNSGTIVLGDSSDHTVTITDTVNDLQVEDPTENGLVGYWKFDEGHGFAATDYSGNGNHGTFTDGPIWMTTVSPTTTFDNPYALDFVDSIVNAGSDTSLDDLSEISICAWIYPRTIPFDARIYVKDSDGANGKAFLLDSSIDSLEFRQGFSTTDGHWQSPTNSIVTNVWSHVCVTYADSATTNNPKMFINGSSVVVTESQTPVGTTDSDATYDATIGNRPSDLARRFNGYMDDFRVYNRILSEAEVFEVANGRYANGDTDTSTITLGAALDVNGDLSIQSGTLDASATPYNINVAGDWNNYSGVDAFTARTGTVDLDGAPTTQNVRGNTNFYNFEISTSTAQTVNFESSASQTILTNGSLTLTGAASNLLTLAPLTSASDWLLDLTSGATQSVSYVSVSYSDASAGQEILANDGTSTDGGSTNNWKFGRDISGTTNLSSGTVAVAVNSALRSSTTSISGSVWTVSNVTIASGDVITVFANTATEANETTAVTKYDGSGDVTGMVLNKNVLSIGSADDQSLTGTNLGLYDNADDEDIMHMFTAANILTIDASANYTNEMLDILSGDTLTIATDETLEAHNVNISGTLTATGSATLHVSGSWTNAGTFTANSSHIMFTGTESETLTSGGTSYNDVTLNDGLVGYWKFDETSDNTCSGGVNDSCDSSGYGHDGVWGNDTTASTSVPGVNFVAPRSVTFDGTDDYIDFGDLNAIEGTSFSIAAWVLFHNNTADADVFTNGNHGTGEPLIIFRDETVGGSGADVGNTNCLSVLVYDGTTQDWYASSNESLDDTNWHHIAVVINRSDSTLNIYIDGVLDRSGTLNSNGVQNTTNPFRIGEDIDATGVSLDGKVDDVRVYNRAISAAEIARLSAGYQPATGDGTYTLQDALDVNGDLALNSGTLDVNTNKAVAVAGSWFNHGGILTAGSGTVTLDGTASGKTLLSGQQQFNNLTVNGTGGEWTFNDDTTVSGTLTLTDGTLTHSTLLDPVTVTGNATVNGGTFSGVAANFILDGDLTFTSGTFTAPSEALILKGDVTQSGGTFSHNSGTIVLGDSTDHTVTITSTVNDLQVEDPTENGLVGYWKLDEGHGFVATDYSGSGNDGTLINGPTWVTTLNSTTTYHNPYAMHFDGVDDYVDAGEHSTEETSYTVAFWFYLISNSSTDTLFHRGDAGDCYYNPIVQFDGTDIIIKESGCANGGLISTTAVNLGVWYHLGLTRNGQNADFYLNGSLVVHDTAQPAPLGTSDADFYVGAHYGSSGASNWFNGLIDDVRVYNRALLATEISALAAGKYGNGDLDTATVTLGSALDVNGDLFIQSGTLDVSATPYNINVAGDWNNYSGIDAFTARTGTVDLDGAPTTQNVRGNTNFYNFEISTSTAQTVNFESSASQTILTSGSLTLTGASGQLLTLAPLTAATNWLLDLTSGASQSVSYVSVSYSDASAGTEIDASDGTNTDGGNTNNWKFGQSISGTTNLSSGRVAVAVNSSIRSSTTDISGSVWTITNVTLTSSDIITVFVDGEATESNETTAVTKYDGSGDVSGMVLNKNVLSIGSADDQSLTGTNLGLYDNADDEDIMHMFTAANVLTIDASANYTNDMLDILSGDTLTIATDETLEAHNVNISGTLTATGSATLHVSGSWTNAGTFTANSSHVMFTGTESETLTSGGTSYNDLTLNDGLIGYWKLDESAGPTLDSSGYGNSGTWNGTPVVGTAAPLEFLNTNSLEFDGVAAYVEIPDAPEFDLIVDAVSISAWVYRLSDQASWKMVTQRQKGTGSDQHYFFGFQNNVFRWFVITSDGESDKTLGSTPSNNQWIHMCGTYDGANAILYVNGSVDFTDAHTGTFSAGDKSITIGAANNGNPSYGEFLNARIDDVRYYNRALSANECGKLAAGRQPGTASGTYTLQDALDVNGDLTLNAGTLDVNTNKAVTVAGSWINQGGVLTAGSGTVTLDGTASGKTLLSGQQSFNNLTVNGTGGEWTFNDDSTVSGTLTLTDGTLTHSTLLDPVTVTANMTVNNGTFSGVAANFILDGDLTFSSGTFTAPSKALMLKGDVTQSGGTFSHNSGTVVLGDSANHTVTITSSLNDLQVEDPTTNGLVGYWKLDEGHGFTATDYSGSSNHGTLTNQPVWITTVNPTTTFDNPYALEFDGNDDYINVGSGASLDDLSDISICAWIYPRTIPNDARLYVKDDGAGSEGKSFLFDETISTIWFRQGFDTTDGRWKSPTNSIVTNAWSHLCLTYSDGSDTNDPIMYINGSSVTVTETQTPSGTRDSDAAYDAWVGNRPDLARPFDGYIDDFRVYNRILSASEAAALAAGKYANGDVDTATVTLGNALDVNGDLSIQSGTLDVSATPYNINIAGDWNNYSGVNGFTARTGTVDLDGAPTTQNVRGNTNFYNFEISTSTAQTVNFESGASQTILTNGSLTFTGASGQLLTLAPLTAASDWKLDLTSGASQSVSYVSVSYSDASAGTEIDASDGTNTDGGNTINWLFGLTISGTTNLSSGTVAVAVNSTLRAATTAISGSVWTVSNITFSSGDIITVFANTAAESDETTAVTKYDGSGVITGMVLNQNVLSIGSADDQSLTATNLGQYDNADDEDIMHMFTAANVLTIDASANYTNDMLDILSGDTLTIATDETLEAHNVNISGTLTATGSATLHVSGSWTNAGTFTANSSHVMFTGTESETLTSGGTSYNDLTLNDGLVGYWKLDETSSPSLDSSGYGNDGIWNNTPTASTNTPSVNFSNSGSLDFNSGSDYIDVGNPPELNISGDITVMAWVNFSGSKNNQVIVSRWGGGIESYVLLVSSTVDNALAFCIRVSDVNKCATSTNTYNDGQWHHVAGFFDGSNVRLIIDGGSSENVTGDATLGPIDTPVINVNIVGYEGGGTDIELVDDVRIYNRALSTAEIARLAVGRQPATGSGTYTLQDALDVNGDLALNSGTLDVNTNKAVTVAGSWMNHGGILTAGSGTVTLDGTASGKTLLSGQQQFNNLTVNGTGGEWTFNDDATVSGALTLTDGTLTHSTLLDVVTFTGDFPVANANATFSGVESTFIIDGSLSLTAGTFTAPSESLIITGAYTHTGGTFSHNSGTVLMTSTTDRTINASSTDFNDIIIGDGLIGYWKLDETADDGSCDGTNDACDSSGYGNHGEWESAPTASTDTPKPFKFTNTGSLNFNGTSDYVDVGGIDVTTAFTMGGWVKFDQLGGKKQALIAKSFNAYQLFASDSLDRVLFQSNSETPIAYTHSFIINNWYHIMLTFNTTVGYVLYLDGIAVKSDSTTTVINTNDITTKIGATSQTPQNFLDGLIDDVRIYNRALSATEVKALAQSKMLEGKEGTYTLASALDVDGDITLADGTLDVSGTPYNINVAGDWNNYSGVNGFTARTATVDLDGAPTTQNVRGSTNFYNFEISTSTAQTVNFESGASQTIVANGSLTLTGASGQLLTLAPLTAATDWLLDFDGATQSVQYVSVSYSDASNGTTIDASDGTSTDGGNTTNWFFAQNISGTTNLSSGRVKVAVNSNLRASTTDISGSVWTVSSVTYTSGDIITVFVDGEAESTESTAVTKHDGSGAITGMVLNQNVLSIGSADDQSLTGTNLGLYDNADDEDIMHMFTAANILTIDASAAYTNEMLDILSGDTLTIATDETLEAHNVNISGTLTATGSATLHVSGSWTNAGTFTTNTSHIMFTGTESETLTSGGTTYNDVTLNDGLVGYWKLDETSVGSTVVDSSGYGYDGTPQGTGGGNNLPQPNADVPQLNFKNVQSLDFDGTDDYVDISSGFVTNQSACSVSFWANIDSGSATGLTVYSEGIPSAWVNSLFIIYYGDTSDTATPSVRVFFRDAAAAGGTLLDSDTSINLADSSWHHVAYVQRASNDREIYIDGISRDTDANNISPIVPTSSSIGAANNNGTFSQFINGLVDDVRTYSRALSAVEIARLAVGRQPATGSGTYTLQDALDVNGDLALNSGTLDVNTNKAVTVAGSWMNHGGILTAGSGTVTLDGTATGKTLLSGQQQFNNLTVNGTGGAWTFNDDATVSGALTLIDGTLTHSTLLDVVTFTGDFPVANANATFAGVESTFIIDGDLSLTAGTFTAPSESLIITGAYTHTGGTFSHNSGTVLMTSTVDRTINATSTTFNDIIIGDGLVGYWKLDETSTPAVDSSGYGNDGIWTNSPTASSDTPKPFKFANTGSLDFDGVDDRVDVGDPDILDMGTNDFTLTAWVKANSTQTDTHPTIINKGGSSDPVAGYWFALTSGTKLWVGIGDGTSRATFDGATDIRDDTWHHVAAVVDRDGNGTIYLDGAVDGTPDDISSHATKNIDTDVYAFGIGGRAGSDIQFTGIIDDVRVYKRALSAVEVKALAQAKVLEAKEGTYMLASALDVDGDITLADGTLDVSGTPYNINVAGDWNNYSGVDAFTARTATVDLDGAPTTQNVRGNTNFYNFEISTSTAQIVNFESGASQTVVANGSLTLTGASGQLLTLAPLTAATDWLLDFDGATQSVQYVSVSYSDASAGTTIDATDGTSTDGGNTTNWFFAQNISGTTNLSSGRVKVAVNSNLRASTTDISGSVWTISSVTYTSGDIITVFVDGEAESTESTAVTKHDGSGAITGMVLNQNVLSIGSADDQSLTGTNLGLYDNTDDEDIMHMFTAANILTIDASANYTNEMLDILSGDTLTIATDETLEAHNVNISGTLTATGSATLHVSGSWTNAGTFTANSSHLMFTGTESETLTSGSTSYNDLTLNDGLVGYWKLDEASGSTATDSSGYGNDGTHTNSPTISSIVPSVNFVNPRSLEFDGANNYVEIIDTGIWDFQTGEYAVSFWFKTSGSAREHALHFGSLSANNLDFDFNDGGYGIWVYWMSGGGNYVRTTDFYNDGSWHHLVVSRNSSGTTLYVDNIVKDQDSGLDNIDIASNGLIGSAIGDHYWDGFLDDVRIYNRELSTTEVARLAAGRQPATGSGTYTLQDALDVNGDLALNSGTLDVNTNKAVTVAGSWMNHGGILTAGSGTVTLDGTASGKTLLSGQQQFNNLTVNGTGGEWTFNDDATVSGTLTLTDGTLTHSTLLDVVTFTGDFPVANANATFTGVESTFIIDGDLSLTAGTFTAPSESLIITGAYTHTGGTFSHNSGTVLMTSTTDRTINATSTTYNDLIIGDGLVGYWKLDETTGSTATDSSGYGNNGTWTNSPTASTDTPKPFKFTNTWSLSFDGTDDYVDMGDVLEMTEANGITLSAWVNASSLTANGAVIDKLGGNGNYRLQVNASGQVRFGIRDAVSSYEEMLTTDTLSTNRWYHLAATFDDVTTGKIYIDGELKKTKTDFTLTRGDTADSLKIGYTSNNAQYFNAKIDDVRIYNRALSASEVSALAQSKVLEAKEGTYTLASALDVDGDITLADGTLDVSATPYNINVAGDWNNYSGVNAFTARTATVDLDGAPTTQNVRGSTNFYNFEISTSTAQTVNFESGASQTILTNGSLTLTGAASNLLTLAPLTAATDWLLDLSSGASQSVSYVSVSYSDASAGATILANDGTNTDGGNTNNWRFRALLIMPILVSFVGFGVWRRHLWRL